MRLRSCVGYKKARTALAHASAFGMGGLEDTDATVQCLFDTLQKKVEAGSP